jgi:hypothetical protein
MPPRLPSAGQGDRRLVHTASAGHLRRRLAVIVIDLVFDRGGLERAGNRTGGATPPTFRLCASISARATPPPREGTARMGILKGLVVLPAAASARPRRAGRLPGPRHDRGHDRILGGPPLGIPRTARHRSVRLTTEAPWWLPQLSDIEQLLRYEAALNTHSDHYPTSALCLYDISSLNGHLIIGLVQTHPRVHAQASAAAESLLPAAGPVSRRPRRGQPHWARSATTARSVTPAQVDWVRSPQVSARPPTRLARRRPGAGASGASSANFGPPHHAGRHLPVLSLWPGDLRRHALLSIMAHKLGIRVCGRHPTVGNIESRLRMAPRATGLYFLPGSRWAAGLFAVSAAHPTARPPRLQGAGEEVQDEPHGLSYGVPDLRTVHAEDDRRHHDQQHDQPGGNAISSRSRFSPLSGPAVAGPAPGLGVVGPAPPRRRSDGPVQRAGFTPGVAPVALAPAQRAIGLADGCADAS